MANPNAPFGLRPVKSISGAGSNVALNEYSVAANYGTALGINDPVKWSSGKIVIAAAGDPICGVCQGFSWTVTATGEKVVAAKYYDGVTGKSNIMALVADDPALVFEVQMTTYAATDVGAAFDFAAGSPDAVTGLSSFYLNASATSGGWTVLGLSTLPNNVVGAYAKVLVKSLYTDHLLS